MHNMLKHKTFLALCLAALPLTSTAHERAATGPLESVQASRQSITVLGQTFVVNSATRFAIDGKRVPPFLTFDTFAADKEVYVEGHDRGSAAVATLVNVSAHAYVAGATPVYVFGVVEEINRDSGLVRLRSLDVDVSTMEPALLATVRVGSLVEIAGKQPLSGGKVVEAELLSVGGSGVQLQSVGGSGIQKQSVGGSGVQVQSVGGSGIQKQSVGGSGVQLQSVGGSGIRRQSVGGSGVLN